ncbi:MAG TPA: hypothetical protein VKD90_18150 [Gemmataceae bacterium]|nr:hypothetical protein [Gemmataceae bacterium]
MTAHRLLAAAAALAALPAARADDLADLFNRVPGDMNTVAVINVREINKTPRAVKENWRENHETEYLAGAMAVPAWVPAVVIAADLHPGAVANARSLALFPAAGSISSESIARRENGVVQSIGDTNIVLSPRRGYIAVPARGIVGVSSTMPRQEFVRWVRAARRADAPAVSAYLRDAVAAHKDAHVLIATDLDSLFDPTSVRQALQRSGEVTGDAAVTSLVNVLSGARGLTFTAQIAEKSKAELRVDFSIPMADFVAPLKRVWPKALESADFEIPEFKAAEPRADGRAVVLTADLSDTSLRRILSLVASPGDAVGSSDPAAGPIRTPKESAALAASLRYYRAVNLALDDLRAQGGAKGKDFVRSATFFDTSASRIERLPLQDVDPALIQYGASVAGRLRAMAGSLRGTKARVEAYESYKSATWAGGGPGLMINPWGRVGIGIGGGGGAALSSNVEELSTRQAELVAALEPERAKIWGVLESDRSAIRREMLEKFRIDFDQFKR